jgi:hypothetical protein
MQLKSYLSGLNYSSFEGINDIQVISRPEIPNSWYYISTYSIFNSNSKKLYDYYKKLGHELKFEFHHIVEERHLKQLYLNESEVKNLYNNVWPCVLLDKNVHKPISMILSTSLPSEIYNVNKEKPLSTTERNDKINSLLSMYTSLYNGNRIFQRIAINVINELKFS